jgi:hypothetical protein
MAALTVATSLRACAHKSELVIKAWPMSAFGDHHMGKVGAPTIPPKWLLASISL